MSSRHDTVPKFIEILRELVDNPDLKEEIRWNESGTSIVIPNIDKLCRNVLGNVFKSSNFSNFVRQLNMYGFRKVHELDAQSRKPATVFHHPDFNTHHPERMRLISRRRSSKKPKQQRMHPSSTPFPANYPTAAQSSRSYMGPHQYYALPSTMPQGGEQNVYTPVPHQNLAIYPGYPTPQLQGHHLVYSHSFHPQGYTSMPLGQVGMGQESMTNIGEGLDPTMREPHRSVPRRRASQPGVSGIHNAPVPLQQQRFSMPQPHEFAYGLQPYSPRAVVSQPFVLEEGNTSTGTASGQLLVHTAQAPVYIQQDYSQDQRNQQQEQQHYQPQHEQTSQYQHPQQEYDSAGHPTFQQSP
eukprot:Clim_evm36s221 gene=Clim_evmTU36s221